MQVKDEIDQNVEQKDDTKSTLSNFEDELFDTTTPQEIKKEPAKEFDLDELDELDFGSNTEPKSNTPKTNETNNDEFDIFGTKKESNLDIFQNTKTEQPKKDIKKR